MAGTTGLEPAASAVTGQRSNQLNYVPQPVLIGVAGKPHVYCTSLLSNVSPVATIFTSVYAKFWAKPTPSETATRAFVFALRIKL